MSRTRKSGGFSLVELLLVLAIIGIISGIAIPSFLMQRRRARIIGDAKSNASVLAMQLESHRADVGLYGSVGTTYTWTNTTAPAASVSPAPYFTTKNATVMTYTLVVGSTGLTYKITVKDTTLGNASVYTLTQAGSSWTLAK